MSAQQFVLELGRAMHALGSSAYRIEDTMDACCRAFGLEGSFFSTPTAIITSIGAPGAPRQFELIRVEPGADDLGHLSALYAVRDAVMRGDVTPEQGLARVRAVYAAPSVKSPLLTIPAQGLVSGAACAFLGGGWREIGVALVAGLAVGILGAATKRRREMIHVFEPLACVLAAFLAHMVSMVTPLDVTSATLAAVIVLLPGLSFTTALAELAMRHLSSGSARLLGAMTVLLTMAIGAGLGSQLATLCYGPANDVAPERLDEGWQAIALLVSAASYGVLLRASLRQLPWILLASAIGFFGGRLGAHVLRPELGAFVGALAVAAAGNAYGQWLRRPAAVLRTPGLLMLVPGSIGFAGFTMALDGGVIDTASLGLRMVLVGGSIVAGLLMASVLVPPPLDVEPAGRREQPPPAPSLPP